MLVLSRKEDQSIVINGDIKIIVAAIQSGKVRLGIEAPQDVPIHRQEIAKQSRSATRKPTQSTFGDHSRIHLDSAN